MLQKARQQQEVSAALACEQRKVNGDIKVSHLQKKQKKIGGKGRVVCIDETHFSKQKRNAGGFVGKVTLVGGSTRVVGKIVF